MNLQEIPLILQLDVAGNPKMWIDYERSAYHYAKDNVAWSTGKADCVLHGGISSMTGKQSTLTINTIIAIRGDINQKFIERSKIPSLDNEILFRRDRHICGYCGNSNTHKKLTRDHIIPVSKKGKNIWMNVITACTRCNKKKADKTPEQANMPLLYVPYIPNRAEALILRNRRILADQMEFLIKQVPKESRLLECNQ